MAIKSEEYEEHEIIKYIRGVEEDSWCTFLVGNEFSRWTGDTFIHYCGD